MKKISSIIWGILFIVVGLIFALNALELTDINIFFDGWWTLFIIVPCFAGLFKDDNKSGSIVGLSIGCILLLACQDILNFEIVWKLIFPIILVSIGLSFLLKDVFHTGITKAVKKLNKDGGKVYCSTFGSQNVDLEKEEFKGCDLEAVFGGIKIDLRDAKLKSDVVINASAVFGGIDILVPSNVKVKVTSTPIFGGVDNKFKNAKDEKAKTIYVNATCIFGGVEIK